MGEGREGENTGMRRKRGMSNLMKRSSADADLPLLSSLLFACYFDEAARKWSVGVVVGGRQEVG